jgi:hypothetical protein
MPLAAFLVLIAASNPSAQQKLLTVEDIFDPVKRVNFNGTTPTVRWLRMASITS